MEAAFNERESKTRELKAAWKNQEAAALESNARIERAIDAGDLPTLQKVKLERSGHQLNTLLAELAYQRSRISLHEALTELARARKAAALEEMIRLGYENGFPEGKKAAQVAKDAYELSGVPSKNATAPILARIEELKAALAA